MKNENESTPATESLFSPPPGMVDKPAETKTDEKKVETVSSPEAANFATGQLAARIEKRGRHPKGCKCGNCSQSRPAGQIPSKVAGVSNSELVVAQVVAPISPEERELCKTACQSITNIMDLLAVLAVGRVYAKKGASPANQVLAKQKAIMPEETRRGLVMSATAVAEKRGVARLAPEISLGVNFSAWLAIIGNLLLAAEDKEP